MTQHCGFHPRGTFLQLKAQKEQNRTLQQSLEKQQEVLTATKAREMQSLQQLSRHKQTIHELQQKAASSRRKMAELLEQVMAGTGQPHDAAGCHAAPSASAAGQSPERWPGVQLHLPVWPLPDPPFFMQVEEVASLKAELAQAQRKIGHNLPLLGRYEEERQQLHRELKKQQRAQAQSQQEVSMTRAFPLGTCAKPACLVTPLCHCRPAPSRSSCKS